MKTKNELSKMDTCDGNEYYDGETGTYYNKAGQQLRDPDEYNPDSEGYTPFGDE